MTIYGVTLSIVRRELDEPLPCANGDGTGRVAQLMIRRETTIDQKVEYWHFSCALLNEIVIEDTIVRLARAFKGRTR